MKNTIYTYILLLIGFLVSCEKNLDLAPEDTLTEASYFQNEKEYKLFATRFYTFLPTPASEDNNTDIGFKNGSTPFQRGDLLKPESDGTWNDTYDQIRATNFLLEKIESVKGDEIYSSLKQYKAEALFFRAHRHFALLNVFGGVPIVKRRLDINSPELQAPRNTRKEVYDFIVADLKEASTLVKMEHTGEDIGRLDVHAVNAYLARVALFEGTWRKYHKTGDSNAPLEMAIELSKKVIDSKKYELFDRRDVLGDESYKSYFTLDSDGGTNKANVGKDANKETILAARFDKNIRESHLFAPLIDAVAMSPTKKLMDMYLCADGLPIDKSPNFKGYATMISEYENRDPRMVEMFYIPNKRYYNFRQTDWQRDFKLPDGDESKGFVFMKTPSDLGPSKVSGTGYAGQKFTVEVLGPRGPDYPVIRLAEVLLMYAEAKFEREGAISDGDLDISINKLRARVGMPKLTNSFVSSNGLDMKTEIRRERTIELSFEGFRLSDIRRWKIAETVMNEPIRGIKYTGTQWETFLKAAPGVLDGEGYFVLQKRSAPFDPAKDYLFPLPDRQIILNPNLKQNPGW